jgi:hypothetical protein
MTNLERAVREFAESLDGENVAPEQPTKWIVKMLSTILETSGASEGEAEGLSREQLRRTYNDVWVSVDEDDDYLPSVQAGVTSLFQRLDEFFAGPLSQPDPQEPK